MAETDKNKVHFDLVDVHVAKVNFDGGKVAFGTPKKLEGSISMDLSPEGDVVKLRADGTDYYTSTGNNGYSGDLNLAMVPDWFREEYLGNTVSTKDKVMVEDANTEPERFALLYGFKYDKQARRHVLYNCMASRPNIHGENKDNPKEPDTESLPLTCSPLPDGKVKASTTYATPTAVFDGWFDSVWEKDSTT